MDTMLVSLVPYILPEPRSYLIEIKYLTGAVTIHLSFMLIIPGSEFSFL